MNKRVTKIFVIISILIIIINIFAMCFNNVVLGFDVTENPGAWKPTTPTENTANFTTELGTFYGKVGKLAGGVQTFGIIVSVVTLGIIGIRYMVGSVEEKAQYKQLMMPWVVGAVMVLALTSIPSIIYTFAKGVFN